MIANCLIFCLSALGPTDSFDENRIIVDTFYIRTDLNRDRIIEHSNSDRTSEDFPFKFWVNDDYDVVTVRTQGIELVYEDLKHCSADLADNSRNNEICTEKDLFDEDGDYASHNTISGDADATENQEIESVRDLEDFFPIEIAAPAAWTYDYGSSRDVEFFIRASGGIEINGFLGSWDESVSYNFDHEIAIEQVNTPRLFYLNGTQQEKKEWEIPQELFDNSGKVRFIAEALKPTIENDDFTESIEFVAKDAQGHILAEDSLYLNFKKLTNLYQHFTAGDSHSRGHPIHNPARLTFDSMDDDESGLELPTHDNRVFVFVHGWRMRPFERRHFANTAFKRMYWNGFKGNMVLFSWPTEWWDPGLKGLALNPSQVQNYDRSELQARRSSATFLNLLRDFRNDIDDSEIYVLAHSMGNVVVSETLRRAASNGLNEEIADIYFASQAAEVASAYNPAVANLPSVYSYSPRLGIRRIDKVPDKYSFSGGMVHQRDPEDDSERYNWLKDDTIAAHYYAGISDVSGRIINIFNSADYALDKWEINQALKPNYGWKYLGTANTDGSEIEDSFCRGTFTCDTALFWGSRDHNYQILSQIVQAQSSALGATHNVHTKLVCNDNGDCLPDGGAYKELGLQDAIDIGESTKFNFTGLPSDHSGQFYGNMVNRRFYWKEIFDHTN